MTNKKLAVVGGGQMGRALVGGMLASDVITAGDVRLVEPSEEGRQWWADNNPAIVFADLASAVSESDLVLLAVKPNIVPIVADQPTGFWSGKLVVSIAAGISLCSCRVGLNIVESSE